MRTFLLTFLACLLLLFSSMPFSLAEERVFPKVSFHSTGEEGKVIQVLKGSSNIPALQFFVTADKGITLQKLSLKSSGIGLLPRIERGKLLLNGEIIAVGNPDPEVPGFSFANLDLLLVREKKAVFELVIDLASDVIGDTIYQFSLRPDDFLVKENLVAHGQKTIQGPAIKVLPVLADVAIIDNPSRALKLPRIDAQDQTIGQFTITAGTHDLLLRRIKLHQDGQLHFEEFENVRLRADKKIVSRKKTFVNKILDFKTSPVLVKKGRSKTFTVIADIKDPWKVEKIRLYLAESQDIALTDIDSGVGPRIENRFSIALAWCAGANTSKCPSEGFRKQCSRRQIKEKVRDC